MAGPIQTQDLELFYSAKEKNMKKERWGGDGCLAGAAQQVELRELKLQRRGPGGK